MLKTFKKCTMWERDQAPRIPKSVVATFNCNILHMNIPNRRKKLCLRDCLFKKKRYPDSALQSFRKWEINENLQSGVFEIT